MQWFQTRLISKSLHRGKPQQASLMLFNIKMFHYSDVRFRSVPFRNWSKSSCYALRTSRCVYMASSSSSNDSHSILFAPRKRYRFLFITNKETPEPLLGSMHQSRWITDSTKRITHFKLAMVQNYRYTEGPYSRIDFYVCFYFWKI